MATEQIDSAFLRYLIDHEIKIGDRIPPLKELSEALGVSVGKLREQLEVARQLGVVSVRPRSGIHREPFRFELAITPSLLFGVATDNSVFAQYSTLRQALESAFWHEAVTKLTPEDMVELQGIVAQAWNKLRGAPVHVPRSEHRAFHLLIFSRLDNMFVQGLLKAYWDVYAASEMTRLATYQYWLDVWHFHERIVEALQAGDVETGRLLLVEHFSLLRELPPFDNANTHPNGAATGKG